MHDTTTTTTRTRSRRAAFWLLTIAIPLTIGLATWHGLTGAGISEGLSETAALAAAIGATELLLRMDTAATTS